MDKIKSRSGTVFSVHKDRTQNKKSHCTKIRKELGSKYISDARKERKDTDQKIIHRWMNIVRCDLHNIRKWMRDHRNGITLIIITDRADTENKVRCGTDQDPKRGKNYVNLAGIIQVPHKYIFFTYFSGHLNLWSFDRFRH